MTNSDYVDTVRENLTELPPSNIIAEPQVKDTAGAIGLAAAVLTKFDPDASMAVLTADQIIEPTHILQHALKDAFKFIEQNPTEIVTFGIKPNFPSTQFGYIKCGPPKNCPNCKNQIYDVEQFKEKPPLDLAEKYFNSGQYLWNSGLFVWKAAAILDMLYRYVPQTKEPLEKIKAAWDTPNQVQELMQWFPKMPKISIDYAVIEKSLNVHAIKLDCKWIDMGSFAALADFVRSDQNNNIVVASQSELLDSKNNIIVTEDKKHLIAAIGLNNTVVAHTPDATLICHKDQTDQIKLLLEKIELHGNKNFL